MSGPPALGRTGPLLYNRGAIGRANWASGHAKRPAAFPRSQPGGPIMLNRAYWYFSYLGLMTVWASFIMGFRHAPDAPLRNVVLNILLYGVFIVIHILLTMPHMNLTH